MIIQFPTPYPDELLFSVIARYHIRSGNVFWKHTLEDLFGKRTISATVLLPSGIGSLVQRLPKNTTLNEQILIEKHTMYPFYTVFIPTEKAQSIYESMISNDGKKIYMQSGIMASSIPQNKYLKYCSACAREDIATFGEMYWHRTHQLPGNLICTKHELCLEDSDVLITHSNKHAFILPTTSNCDLNRKSMITETSLIQLKNIVLQAEDLLNRKYQNQTFSHFTQFYRYHLIEKGYASLKGQVKQKALYDAFYNLYSEELLNTLCIEPRATQWIANFSRKHRKSFHPYYHLLMLNFFDLKVNAAFEETSFENTPFGHPNWPCLNATCPDYKKNAIPEITIRRCEKTKKLIGRFTCHTCDFSYTRKGMDPNKDDCYKFSRIMDFGFLWKRELQLLLNKGLSYREVARILGVDTNTVIKYEKKNIENKQKAKVRIDSDLVKEHRYEWIHLQRDFPGLSKTELRKKRPEVYAYLYRHDRDWLKVNSPKRKKVDPTNNRVNWLERDKEILEKVQKVVSELRGIDKKPVRITVKILGDGIGERALLERHLDKLPETRVFIEKVSESEQDFRLRRVKYVINEMMEKGEEIKEWKVLRKAAIKKEFYKEFVDFLKRE
ncbi:TnsD family Tn7-like transposition protein [Evansella cellulosilytica]|uniref:Tn7-like transposition protein D n=1 Tax=Evansella cellulosilytica (strain ATCC 21833 / DSM 2522 / FERM P-1141 / JCM 9156 / N-4) TaxID=649639 RepID=E6TU48_EVAC2|nr:TnsD family Tn7-like transposition protein [Evansella cellulosilytica]ADU28508.1 Tn7-like transposition protein D [Evansella cellulosilytica DSM 2522]